MTKKVQKKIVVAEFGGSEKPWMIEAGNFWGEVAGAESQRDILWHWWAWLMGLANGCVRSVRAMGSAYSVLFNTVCPKMIVDSVAYHADFMLENEDLAGDLQLGRDSRM